MPGEPLVRALLLPAHEALRGRRTMSAYRRSVEIQQLSRAELGQTVARKTVALLRHCFEQVPYYRAVLEDHGIKRGDDIDEALLPRLPVLDKSTIRNHLESLVARNQRRQLIRYSTGGTSGAPMVFYTDRNKETVHNALNWRSRAWFGFLPGDRQLDLWGSDIELRRNHVYRRLKDRLLNHVVVSAFELSEAKLQEYTRLITRFRPKMLYGYPSALAMLADYVRGSGIHIPDSVRLVVCTAEMLFDHQRDRIADAFGARVVNEYGARDGGLMAHECTAGNMHVVDDHVIIEVEDADDAGYGDALITNLDGFGMPLVRYRIGDKVRLDNDGCECGLPFRVLGGLAGRVNDFVVTPDGERVHGLALVYALRPYRATLQSYKIIQQADYSLLLQYVAGRELSSDEMLDIEKRLTTAAKAKLTVLVERVTRIPPGANGKFRAIECRVEALAA